MADLVDTEFVKHALLNLTHDAAKIDAQSIQPPMLIIPASRDFKLPMVDAFHEALFKQAGIQGWKKAGVEPGDGENFFKYELPANPAKPNLTAQAQKEQLLQAAEEILKTPESLARFTATVDAIYTQKKGPQQTPLEYRDEHPIQQPLPHHYNKPRPHRTFIA